MTAYGFDLDGTLTMDPGIWKPMMAALIEAGNNVYIVTAICDPNTNELQMRKVEELGFVKGGHFTELVLIDGGCGSQEDLILAGKRKADACRIRNVVLFIDDRPDWCVAISEVCQTLLVVPRS